MTVVLWILQLVLALFYLGGGAYKALMSGELAQQFAALPRPVWVALGVMEIAGAALLVLPAAMNRMPRLTPLAAAVLAVETLGLAWLYSRYSLAFSVENPMTWALGIGLLAAVVAYGTRGRYAQAA